MHVRRVADGERAVGAVNKTRCPTGTLSTALVKSPKFLIVISTRPSTASALDENENGCPVILNGLPHTVSQPNWPGLKRKPG